eukprot:6175215-Pleurochrysis_carterae.AAC.5
MNIRLRASNGAILLTSVTGVGMLVISLVLCEACMSPLANPNAALFSHVLDVNSGGLKNTARRVGATFGVIKCLCDRCRFNHIASAIGVRCSEG